VAPEKQVPGVGLAGLPRAAVPLISILKSMAQNQRLKKECCPKRKDMNDRSEKYKKMKMVIEV
jgi:hypothetical protein